MGAGGKGKEGDGDKIRARNRDRGRDRIRNRKIIVLICKIWSQKNVERAPCNMVRGQSWRALS
ncbi:MAG TPA: hypothetical protein P5182_09480, partial [Myxococcota bacterium]|nr:hypothetical protein [Myxococcota bacterium]